MKVLLISANRVREPYPVYPLGLDYVAGALAADHHVGVLDLNQLPAGMDLEGAIGAFGARYRRGIAAQHRQYRCGGSQGVRAPLSGRDPDRAARLQVRPLCWAAAGSPFFRSGSWRCSKPITGSWAKASACGCCCKPSSRAPIPLPYPGVIGRPPSPRRRLCRGRMRWFANSNRALTMSPFI
jgi:hypothetical protein